MATEPWSSPGDTKNLEMIEPKRHATHARLQLNSCAWRALRARVRAGASQTPARRLLDCAMYEWTAPLFTACDALQRAALGDRLRSTVIRDDPVFIVGFWRSGTTLLHELLSLDQQFSFPRTHQCMSPATMLLGNAAKRGNGRGVSRPMDSMVITSDSPQEDEFALLALGAPSPYRMLVVPADVTEAVRLLRPSSLSPLELLKLRSTLLDFLRRLAYTDQRRMLLKSPTHSFRIRQLLEWFPESRFVHISRDPLDCYLSNQRLWQTLFASYALTPFAAAHIEEFIESAYTALAEELVRSRAVIGARRLVEIRFEDLRVSPEQTLGHIYEHLELPLSNVTRSAWRQKLAETREYQPRSYSRSAGESLRVAAMLERNGRLIRGT